MKVGDNRDQTRDFPEIEKPYNVEFRVGTDKLIIKVSYIPDFNDEGYFLGPEKGLFKVVGVTKDMHPAAEDSKRAIIDLEPIEKKPF